MGLTPHFFFLMNLNTELFAKNKDFLLNQNPNFFETHEIDVDICTQKYNQSRFKDEYDFWSQLNPKTIHYPSQIARLDASRRYLEEKLQDLSDSTDIEDFINIDVDVQFFELNLRLRQKLVDLGIDPENTATALGTGGTSIVALGVGSGELFLKLINDCNPYAVHILLSDWHDFFSSFYHVDWTLLSREFSDKNVKFSITCVSSADEFLWKLREQGLFYLDHAYLFCSPSTDSRLVEFSTHLDGNIVKNWVRYLGYTLDEYNMIVQAADTLHREPRSYLKPIKPLRSKFVVCGSGPSLDNSIPALKQLQNSHVIVCGGSSYKALIEAGVRVDFLSLMERDYDIGNDDYAGFHDSIGGCPDSVRLVMAAECYHKMLDTFPKNCTFFRASLTSANLYANNNRQLIPLEGPEAVNAAASFCAELGAEQILLVGVDLGSKSQDVTRSSSVLGNSNRIFDQECPGNFSDTVYTCDSMINVQQVLEALSKNIRFQSTDTHKTSLYNASDGILINGFEPIDLSTYCDLYSSCDSSLDLTLQDISPSVCDWWSSLKPYTREDFWAQWQARSPRRSTFNFCRSLESALNSPVPWFPHLVSKIEDLFCMESSIQQQIPMRIMRGTILKGVLAVSQQLHVLRYSKPEIIHEFLAYSKTQLLLSITKIESQSYQIFDYVESNHGN